MNTQKLHQLSSQVGQAILNASRILVVEKNCFRSWQVGWPSVPGRGYTVPSAPGSGAGKGGGPGGSVRESGVLGQYGTAHEEEFFYHKKREQLEKIKSKLKKEEPKSPQISRKEDK